MSANPIDTEVTNPAAATLRTGAVVGKPTALATWQTLNKLFDDHPVTFFELVQIAQNPGHAPFGNSAEALCGWGLIDEGGRMHADIRAVVLASVKGDGFDLELVHPIGGDR